MLWLRGPPPLCAIRRLASPGRHLSVVRWIHAGPSTSLRESRYAEKLEQKAKEQGLDLSELKSRARAEARRKELEQFKSTVQSARPSQAQPQPQRLKNLPSELDQNQVLGTSSIRKDSSPVKPLESILNVQRILSAPHTTEQISGLWTAYHASRTGGTGRGFICASVPSDFYSKMLSIGKRYPMFVVPVPREDSSAMLPKEQEGLGDTAHEFYFLQWDFHAPPSPSSATVFEQLSRVPLTTGDATALPPTATVLFTPLQEYKLRQSFSTPYLILTFYPDFAQTHGLVLLRGEITPSAATAAANPAQDTRPTRFLLSQVDAQLLAMGVQKFYLWGNGSGDDTHGGGRRAEELLRQFHESPEEFNWQDLLEHARLTTP